MLMPLVRLVLGAFALSAVAIASPANAQGAAAPVPAPAAAPAATTPPTPAQLELGRQIIIGSGISRSFTPIVPQMMNQLWGTLTPTRPEIVPDLKLVMEALQPEFEAQEKQLLDAGARIFATRMTEPELKDIAAFFATSSGKKYVEAQPLLLDELVTEIDAWRKSLSSNMMDRVRAEMKKKGHVI